MRMQKWVFLLSYIIYLLWAIAYAIVSKEYTITDTLIFSVTVASTFFSMSDLIYTKFDIDRKKSDETFTLLFLTKYAENFYMQKIEVKYGKGVEKKLSTLRDLLGEEGLEKIVSSNLTKSEEETYLSKVNDIELKKFLAVLIQTQRKSEKLEEKEDDDKQVVSIFNVIKRREKFYFSLPSILAVIGLVSLLIILTLRVKPQPKINNVCTLVAFLSVIVSLMLKECYKAKLLEQLANERREIIRDMKENR